MDTNARKAHWENVFQSKDTTKVSWHQPVPKTSIQLIGELNLPKTTKIIEVGAGDSFLGDYLLREGFSDITLLDISEKALEKVQSRLIGKEDYVTYLPADITEFSSNKKFDLWHDRAVFHFLTDQKDVSKYLVNVAENIHSGGYLIIGTFSDNGPNRCSDLNVQQYSEKDLVECFEENFNKIKCFKENHITPSNGSQNFTFCVFQRK